MARLDESHPDYHFHGVFPEMGSGPCWDQWCEKEVHVTKPHGQHRVILTEDHPKAGMRLYEVRDVHEPNKAIGWTGEELDSLTAWWQQEKQRTAVVH